jgi:hypothetical protein
VTGEEGEMPKESVYGIQHIFDPPSNDNRPMVPTVDVLWGREGGYVQIVTKVEDAHGGRWVGDSPETHFTDGMYVDLDRNEINRLIRNLRRARDQAFGKDE